MPRPKRKQMEVPSLLEILRLGGEAPWRNLIEPVAAHFPQMTQGDVTEPAGKKGKATKWEQDLRWTSWILKKRGELERGTPRKGWWKITARGRQRLTIEGMLPKGADALSPQGPEVDQRPLAKAPTRHEELKQRMVEIGGKLSYYTSTEEGPEYRHDVLWRNRRHMPPSHVIEVCEGGVLAKDFDALNWAHENWDARGILIVTEEKDFERATRRFAGQPGLTAVMAETVDAFYKMVDENLRFLEFIFGKGD